MIKLIFRKYSRTDRGRPIYIEKFVMDAEADFANLPKAAPGSYAVVADGSKQYMVNASGQWVEHSGGTEQIRAVVNSVLEESLGGEY